MRKTYLLALIWLFCALLPHSVGQTLSGYWEGVLRITATDSLRLGMVISYPGDTLNIVLDSPDQYAFNIPVAKTAWRNDTLSWTVPSLTAAYTGRYDSVSQQISGTFKQGRAKLPLVLMRGRTRMVPKRPQEPHPPYPYTAEDIRFKDRNGRYELINGTLTLPAQNPKALVVLLSGSGWQNRDEELFGHKPFLLLADRLTRQGYAVFRYDDLPKAIFAQSNTFDFADGVTLILDSLSLHPALRGVPVALLGHSEGSLVAEIVAARDKRVSAVITLGGVSQPIADILLYQTRALYAANGQMSPAEVERSVALSSAIYNLVQQSKSREQAKQRLSEFYKKISSQLTPEEQETYGFTPSNQITQINTLTSNWFFTLFHIQPQTYIKKIKCPMLVIGGEKDLQVPTERSIRQFQKHLPKHPHHRYITVPSANHLLQTCTTGGVNEYGKIEETLQESVLEEIPRWLNEVYP